MPTFTGTLPNDVDVEVEYHGNHGPDGLDIYSVTQDGADLDVSDEEYEHLLRQCERHYIAEHFTL